MSFPDAQQPSPPVAEPGGAQPGVAQPGVAQPGVTTYGASPYGAPERTTSTASTGQIGPTAPARSPLGVVSFIVAVANIILGWVLSFAISGAIVSATDSYATVGVLQLVNSVITVLFALVSLVTGVIALLKRGAPKGLAAAGTALGGEALFGVLMGLAQAVFYQLF